MPGVRLRNAEIAAVEADVGISAKEGEKLVDQALDHLESWSKSTKSKGLAESLSIMVELKRRFTSLVEEETLEKLATIYYTMDDEKPDEYLPSDQERKKAAWNLDRKAKDFFLCKAAEITGFFGNTSDKDILLYLRENQPELTKAVRFLEKSGLKNT